MENRIAFAGFRHYHIMEAWELASKREDLRIVAAAEDDEAVRLDLEKRGVRFTHPSVNALLADSGAYDFLAVGDFFGRRGNLVIRALESGKHVIADKPICTSMRELVKIRDLAATRKRAVGCQLSMRDSAQTRTLKRLIADGTLGRIQTATFLGQHPLNFGKRPGWYFEAGKHGGTINDIGIHGIDFLMWALGAPVAEVVAARGWNETFTQAPDFELCAQFMLRMAGGCGVLADVSYTAPTDQGFSMPQYWRFTVHGERGVAETSLTAHDVTTWRSGETAPVVVPLDPPRTGGYLDDFLAEARSLSGEKRSEGIELTTEQVLACSRASLLCQEAAIRKRSHLAVGAGS
jgi:predicted dehydrogenase